MNNYFESIASCRGWLETSPKKTEVLNNANKPGRVSILPDSYNRAVVIEDDNNIFLQSYDTIVLSLNKTTRTIKKLWDGYSVTTLKHVNVFLGSFTALKLNKKQWISLDEMEV